MGLFVARFDRADACSVGNRHPLDVVAKFMKLMGRRRKSSKSVITFSGVAAAFVAAQKWKNLVAKRKAERAKEEMARYPHAGLQFSSIGMMFMPSMHSLQNVMPGLPPRSQTI